MRAKTFGTTELKLPTFKSNIPNDRAFTNVLLYIKIQNTNFVSNTRAFYEDLNRKLDSNEKILEQICLKSIERINKSDN